MSVLLFAFEPFDGAAVNPSMEITRALDGVTIAGQNIVTCALPVAFDAVGPLIDAALATHRPELAIAIGQAGGRAELSLERVAINLIDARIADNAGAQPLDVPVMAGAPPAYFTTLPVKAMRQALQARGIPAQLSLTAGSFVCNQVFFLLMHRLAASGASARAGFVHVPYLPLQVVALPGTPSMALDEMIEGLRVAIDCALRTPIDVVMVGGATH
jgi:pyroglutamyl-peptidase